MRYPKKKPATFYCRGPYFNGPRGSRTPDLGIANGPEGRCEDQAPWTVTKVTPKIVTHYRDTMAQWHTPALPSAYHLNLVLTWFCSGGH